MSRERSSARRLSQNDQSSGLDHDSADILHSRHPDNGKITVETSARRENLERLSVDQLSTILETFIANVYRESNRPGLSNRQFAAMESSLKRAEGVRSANFHDMVDAILDIEDNIQSGNLPKIRLDTEDYQPSIAVFEPITPEKGAHIKAGLEKLRLVKSEEQAEEPEEPTKKGMTKDERTSTLEKLGLFNPDRLSEAAKKELSAYDNPFIRKILADQTMTRELIEMGFVKGNRKTNLVEYNDQILDIFLKKHQGDLADKYLDDLSRRNPKFAVFKTDPDLRKELLHRDFINSKPDNGASAQNILSFLCSEMYHRRIKDLGLRYDGVTFDENDAPNVGFFGRLSGKAKKIMQDPEYLRMKEYHDMVRTLQNEAVIEKTTTGFWKKALTWVGIGGTALTMYADSGKTTDAMENVSDLGIATKIQKNDTATKSSTGIIPEAKQIREAEAESKTRDVRYSEPETYEGEVNFKDEEGTKITVETPAGRARRLEQATKRAEARHRAELQEIADARKMLKSVEESVEEIKNPAPKYEPSQKTETAVKYPRAESSAERPKQTTETKPVAKKKALTPEQARNIDLKVSSEQTIKNVFSRLSAGGKYDKIDLEEWRDRTIDAVRDILGSNAVDSEVKSRLAEEIKNAGLGEANLDDVMGLVSKMEKIAFEKGLTNSLSIRLLLQEMMK